MNNFVQTTSGVRRPRGYPYQVYGVADLPEGLRHLAERALPLAGTVETIFVIPGQMQPKKFGGFGGSHWVPEQALLYTSQGLVHIQAGDTSDKTGYTNYLPGDRLLYARVSLVVLYTRIELCGVVDGKTDRVVVEYNSVKHELLQPAFLNFLRFAWRQAGTQEASNSQDILLAQLKTQSYKFRSGLEKHCLQAGEYLQGFVFQPRIVKDYARIIHHLVAPASLFALTDQQLILIEEGMTSATSYGYFFTFCPRGNVVAVAVKPNHQLHEVRVQLRKDAADIGFRIAQEESNALACQDLWANR